MNNEPPAGLKLLLSYNINSENAQEYYQFVLGKYIPVMQALGLEMSEAWHTAYGNYPNRLVVFVAQEQSLMWDILESDTWQEMTEQLEQYVTDFSYKVVPYLVDFQL